MFKKLKENIKWETVNGNNRHREDLAQGAGGWGGMCLTPSKIKVCFSNEFSYINIFVENAILWKHEEISVCT